MPVWLDRLSGGLVLFTAPALFVLASYARHRAMDYGKTPLFFLLALGISMYLGIVLLSGNFTHARVGDHIAFLCVVPFLYCMDKVQDEGMESLRLSFARKPPKRAEVTPEAMQRYGRKMVPIPTLYPAYNSGEQGTRLLSAA